MKCEIVEKPGRNISVIISNIPVEELEYHKRLFKKCFREALTENLQEIMKTFWDKPLANPANISTDFSMGFKRKP